MQEPIFQRRMVSQNCVAPINLRAVFSYTITRLDQEGGRIKESPTSQMKTVFKPSCYCYEPDQCCYHLLHVTVQGLRILYPQSAAGCY